MYWQYSILMDIFVTNVVTSGYLDHLIVLHQKYVQNVKIQIGIMIIKQVDQLKTIV